MDCEKIKEILASRLKPSRYRHSLGVAETAAFLAERFGINKEKAVIAGLLHDCAREYKDDELIAEAEKRNIPIGEVERAMPLLLHAYIGAQRISELYGIEDAEIAQAIYRHTVGGENMTPLDKIIYFADMIEPNRDYPEVEMLRKLSREASLDEMLLEGLTQSIIFVAEKNHLIHADTVKARNEILLNRVK